MPSNSKNRNNIFFVIVKGFRRDYVDYLVQWNLNILNMVCLY